MAVDQRKRRCSLAVPAFWEAFTVPTKLPKARNWKTDVQGHAFFSCLGAVLRPQFKLCSTLSILRLLTRQDSKGPGPASGSVAKGFSRELQGHAAEIYVDWK